MSIKIQGEMVFGPYKNYFGKAEYDSDAGLFHGEVVGTRDVITFQGKSVAELSEAFGESVDDYLAFCASRNEAPEKPMSGKFIVRVAPEVHQRLAAIASVKSVSLNTLVGRVLKKATHKMVIKAPASHEATLFRIKGRKSDKTRSSGLRKPKTVGRG
jgi:predicted HicB family RNase H-like nuclease